MREPTKAERRKFLKAAKALADLGTAGFYIYLAEDSLNLMIGESHDQVGARLMAHQDRVRESVYIPLSGGGDW